MNNYTTETYQMKRKILNFADKISVGMCKPTQKFAQDMIYGISKNKSVYLTDVARSLKESIKLNNTVDRLVTNLMNLGGEKLDAMKQNYYDEVLKFLPNDTVIVLNDDSDLNKEYSKKLEDLDIVRDASCQIERHVPGYKVCEYVALTENEKSPISLYSKIYSTKSEGFESENTETIDGEDEVIKILNGRTLVFVRDRGYDSSVFFKKDILEDNKFVTRLKGNRNVIFNGQTINVKKLAEKRKGLIKTKLIYKGENKPCKISYMKVELPFIKGKTVTLVCIYGLNEEEPMMLLTNLEVNNKDDALHVARLYFLRWRVEEYFKAKKQNYNWENSLVRTLESMNNLNFFLTCVMAFMSIMIEIKKDSKLSKLILERAQSLKEKAIIYLGMMSDGIFEILKFARTGISEWRPKKVENKQLSLNL